MKIHVYRLGAFALLAAVVGITAPSTQTLAQQSGKTAPGGDKTGGGKGGGGGATPAITNMSAVQVPGKKFRIWGVVSDDTPGQCSVVMTGAANGVANCDASGAFDNVYNVPQLGAVTAIASDGVNQSAPSVLGLTNAPPTVTVIATRSGDQVTISGTVSDEAPAGIVVTLTGHRAYDGHTLTAGAGGAFTATFTIPREVSANVTASVVDWYDEPASGSTSF